MPLEETIILMTSERKYAEIYTEDPKMMEVLAQRARNDPKHYTVIATTSRSISYRCPKSFIHFAIYRYDNKRTTEERVLEMQREIKEKKNERDIQA